MTRAATATLALWRPRIRVPATVGARWMSVAAMTTERNPKTLSQAWAGFSAAQWPATGAQPATIDVASPTPMTTCASAAAYATRTRRARRPSATRSGENAANAVPMSPAR